MNAQLNQIEEAILPLRQKLQNHRLYQLLSSLDDVQVFMETHVYAVWDFMSLLKSLQEELTCVGTPWMPGKNPVLARFINEIVHGEESDVNELGEAKSHFDMYIDAMHEIHANPKGIVGLLSELSNGKFIFDAIDELKVDARVKAFLHFSFDTIHSKKNHCVASAFTFGREDVIPDMFFEIIKNAEARQQKSNYPKLTYYLERHIEVDGGEHGPLSLQMIAELCGNDLEKWSEVKEIALSSLEHRIRLWDCIADAIVKRKDERSTTQLG